MKLNLFGIEKTNKNDNYRLVRSNKFKNKYLKNLAKEYDKIGKIPISIGNELEKICDFDNYFIGVHRTGYSVVDDTFLNDIFNNGLINNGHAMQGVINDNVDIERTVSEIPNFLLLVGALKTAHGYKGSEGSLLIKIPKEYIEGENKKPIYFLDDNTPRLLPEFVYGYVANDNNGNITKIIRNKNYKDFHNYQDDGLICEGESIIRNTK